MSTLPLPAPPTGNRIALVTPDDNSAPLIILTTLSCIFSSLVFAVRILVVKRKRHSLDDGVLGLGHLVAAGQWTAMFIALANDLGESLAGVGNGKQSSQAKALFAGRILLLASLCFSKLSILLIIRSIFYWDSRRKRLIIDGTITLVILWGLGAILSLSLECSPGYVLGKNLDQCPGHTIRIRAVMIIDIATECLIFALVPLFLYILQITHGTRWLVITAFAFRLPLVAFSTMYLLSSTSYIESQSTGTAIVPNIIWQEILLGYSLMSATIPCLKSFVEGFTTGGVRHGEAEIVREPYDPEDSYRMGRVKAAFGSDLGPIEDLQTSIRSSIQSSRRPGSGGRTTEEASMKSQTSEQPIIGMAM